MKNYNPSQIEAKWANFWQESQIYKTPEIKTGDRKKYILDMFPYPSGSGLHIGHPRGYTATDILSRFYRVSGYKVLHPMGWDAFGLPAEQHAVKNGIHPKINTQNNINTFRKQLQKLGFSYDWSREVDTTDPSYYKWTQWIFVKLFEKGLAFEQETLVNWCPELATILANEEIINGKSERGNHPVYRLPLKQWLLKITDYAERLDEDLEKLINWPKKIKLMQKNWIGQSSGFEVDFAIWNESLNKEIEVSNNLDNPESQNKNSENSKIENNLENPQTKAQNENKKDQENLKTTKLNYLFLHGWTASSRDNCLDFYQKVCDQNNLQIQIPDLPNTNFPEIANQVDFVLQNCQINEQTVIIGHSLGMAVGLKVLEKLDFKIAKFISVAGFVDTDFAPNTVPQFLIDKNKAEFDFAKIRENCLEFVGIWSEKDPLITQKQVQNLENSLGILVKKVEGKGHFADLSDPSVVELVFGIKKETLENKNLNNLQALEIGHNVIAKIKYIGDKISNLVTQSISEIRQNPDHNLTQIFKPNNQNFDSKINPTQLTKLGIPKNIAESSKNSSESIKNWVKDKETVKQDLEQKNKQFEISQDSNSINSSNNPNSKNLENQKSKSNLKQDFAKNRIAENGKTDDWTKKIENSQNQNLQNKNPEIHQNLQNSNYQNKLNLEIKMTKSQTETEETLGFNKHELATDKITVYTTRIDTIFGATFLVIAPEHPLLVKITTEKQQKSVQNYCQITKSKSDLERTDLNKDKNGVWTGSFAVNPINGARIPIWVADYVLSNYGTGAIMAVPAHDERDFEFAKKFNLPVIPVILPTKIDENSEAELEKITKQIEALETENLANLSSFISGNSTILESPNKFQNNQKKVENQTKFSDLGNLEYENKNKKILENNSQKDFEKDGQNSQNQANSTILESSQNLNEPKTLQISQNLANPQNSNQNNFNLQNENSQNLQSEKQNENLENWQNQILDGQICFLGSGKTINSREFDNLEKAEATFGISQKLVDLKLAKEKINFKLRDWIFSRQRFWGEPIPIVFEADELGVKIGEAIAVHESDLPVMLPEIDDFERIKPDTTKKFPEAILTKFPEWIQVRGYLLDGKFKQIKNSQVTKSNSQNLEKLENFHNSASSAILNQELSLENLELGQNNQINRDSLDSRKNLDSNPDQISNFRKEKSTVLENKIESKDYQIEDQKFEDQTLPKKQKEQTSNLENDYKNSQTQRISQNPEQTTEDQNLSPQISNNSQKESLQTSNNLDNSLEKTSKLQSLVPEIKNYVRETNTMPQWAGSSWYWLRFMDTQNSESFCDQEKLWGPVDIYVGGAEHAVLHLLYARFWHKVLFDLGLVSTAEPFEKLVNQGLILASDGQKISKSLNNGANPDDIVEQFGADSLRLYEMFIGPFEQSVMWNSDAIVGVRRFLDKFWNLQNRIYLLDLQNNQELKEKNINFGPKTEQIIETALQKLNQKISEDIQNCKFNTCVSEFMKFVNLVEKTGAITWKQMLNATIILAPFTPFISEEIYQNLKEIPAKITGFDSFEPTKKSIHLESWPKIEHICVEKKLKIAIQINGKVRGILEIETNLNQEKVQELVLKADFVQKYISNQEIKKFIYIPNKAVNIILD